MAKVYSRIVCVHNTINSCTAAIVAVHWHGSKPHLILLKVMAAMRKCDLSELYLYCFIVVFAVVAVVVVDAATVVAVGDDVAYTHVVFAHVFAIDAISCWLLGLERQRKRCRH
jgi:hypothetical protein